MPFLCQALKGREDYNEEHPQRTELPLAAAQLPKMGRSESHA